jgi:hypothetical protein
MLTGREFDVESLKEEGLYGTQGIIHVAPDAVHVVCVSAPASCQIDPSVRDSFAPKVWMTNKLGDESGVDVDT